MCFGGRLMDAGVMRVWPSWMGGGGGHAWHMCRRGWFQGHAVETHVVMVSTPQRGRITVEERGSSCASRGCYHPTRVMLSLWLCAQLLRPDPFPTLGPCCHNSC